MCACACVWVGAVSLWQRLGRIVIRWRSTCSVTLTSTTRARARRRGCRCVAVCALAPAFAERLPSKMCCTNTCRRHVCLWRVAGVVVQDLRTLLLAFSGTSSDGGSSLSFCFMNLTVVSSPERRAEWAARNVNASCIHDSAAPCGPNPITIAGLVESSDDLTPGGTSSDLGHRFVCSPPPGVDGFGGTVVIA